MYICFPPGRQAPYAVPVDLLSVPVHVLLVPVYALSSDETTSTDGVSPLALCFDLYPSIHNTIMYAGSYARTHVRMSVCLSVCLSVCMRACMPMYSYA